MSASRPDTPTPPVEPGSSLEPVETTAQTPALRVVRGNPTPEELAALVAVLCCAGGGAVAPTRAAGSAWAAGARAGRSQVPGGAGWRRSGLPH